MSVGISTIRLRMLASICGLLVYLPSKKPALCHLDVLSECDGTDAQPPLFAEPTHRIMWGYTFEDLARRAQEEAAKLAVSCLVRVCPRRVLFVGGGARWMSWVLLGGGRYRWLS